MHIKHEEHRQENVQQQCISTSVENIESFALKSLSQFQILSKRRSESVQPLLYADIYNILAGSIVIKSKRMKPKNICDFLLKRVCFTTYNINSKSHSTCVLTNQLGHK